MHTRVLRPKSQGYADFIQQALVLQSLFALTTGNIIISKQRAERMCKFQHQSVDEATLMPCNSAQR